MTIDKLYTLFDFISLSSSVTDCPLDKQSPEYICSKFEQYIGDFEIFEFPKRTMFDFQEQSFIDSYMVIWDNVNYLSINEDILPQFKNLLIFLKKANWDSGTLPSVKLEHFKKYIGDYSLIREHELDGEGLHELLNRWLNDVIKNPIIQDDLNKLKREFDIDFILNE